MNTMNQTKDFNEMEIEELDLSVRVYKCLKRYDITTCGELLSMTSDELKHIRNLGGRGYDEIIDKLAEYGKALSPVATMEEKAANKRKRPLAAQILSAAHFAENNEVKAAVLESNALRNETLNVCYGIPGYKLLPREEKIKLYDLVKKSISLSRDKGKELE